MRLAALLICAAALWSSSADASTQHHREHARPFRIPVFELPGTNGYHLEVFGIAGRRGEADQVGVVAWSPTSSTSYVASGRVSRGRFRASLGRFGRVDVSFRREGARWVRSPCDRKPSLFATGVYEGTVEFKGEEGFTQIIEPAVEAEPLYNDPWACGSEIDFGTSPGVYLNVYSRYGETIVVQNSPGAAVRYDAMAENRIGRIKVNRLLEVMGPAAGFRWSKNLKRATVTPPAPFSGTATYRALGGTTTHWEGNLRVDFPGYPLNLGPSLTEFIHGACHVYFPPSSDPHPPFGCLG